MKIIAFLISIFGFFALLAIAAVVGYFLVRRINERNRETFEKRDN